MLSMIESKVEEKKDKENDVVDREKVRHSIGRYVFFFTKSSSVEEQTITLKRPNFIFFFKY